MSSMQESIVGSDGGSHAPEPRAAQGFHEDHREIVWGRSDWQRPVGWLSSIVVSPRRSEVRELQFKWQKVDVPELLLSHNAALLMLQGKSLGEILIPNHHLSSKYIGLEPTPVAHVLLRVDPWAYWESLPRLTGLVLARLGELPAGLGAAEVLAALVQDSAA